MINEDDERLILYEIKNLQFNTNFNFNNRESLFESAEKQVIDLQEQAAAERAQGLLKDIEGYTLPYGNQAVDDSINLDFK